MKLALFAVLLVLIPFQAEAVGCIGKSLKVWVAYGKDLRDDEVKPDLYVEVKIDNVTESTGIIHQNNSPAWWKKLPFNNVASNLMTVMVFNAVERKGAKDELLGTCTKKLVDNGTTHVKCYMNNEEGFVWLFYNCEQIEPAPEN